MFGHKYNCSICKSPPGLNADHLHNMPVNVWQEIFAKLPLSSLPRASRICKSWHMIAQPLIQLTDYWFCPQNNKLLVDFNSEMVVNREFVLQHMSCSRPTVVLTKGYYNAFAGRFSLFKKLALNEFSETRTFSDEIRECEAILQIGDKHFKCNLYDHEILCGEQFEFMHHSCYRMAACLIICYSIISERSLMNIMEVVLPCIRKSMIQPSSIILVGTYSDLKDRREVSLRKGRELAEQIGADFFECSSKTGHNIQELKLRITRLVCATYMMRRINDCKKQQAEELRKIREDELENKSACSIC